MKHWIFTRILVCFLLVQAVALPQTPPQAFVYKITMSGGAGTGSMDYTMDVAIKSTNADGSRPASLTIHAPKMPPLDKKTMDATLTPSGAITVGSTGEMPTGGFNPYNVAKVKQMQAASTGPLLQTLINPFNAFASGLSAAPSFKTGATWHAQSGEAMADVIYTVTGHEQRNGRDTAVITMKTSPGGASVTGQGNYDPQSRLVIAVHSEIRQSADAKEGEVLDAVRSP